MKSKTRKPIKVFDQTWQKARCRACQDVSAQPWLLSNGHTYCSRCVEELLGLGWAERMGEEQQVMSGAVEPAGLILVLEANRIARFL